MILNLRKAKQHLWKVGMLALISLVLSACGSDDTATPPAYQPLYFSFSTGDMTTRGIPETTLSKSVGMAAYVFENGNARQLAERLQQATQVDWPQRSAEAMQIASKFEIQTIIGQWQSTLGL